MHALVISTFSRLTQRPSGVKLWHRPAASELPSSPRRAERSAPELVHATSYLAASARISSFWAMLRFLAMVWCMVHFSRASIPVQKRKDVRICKIYEHMYPVKKGRSMGCGSGLVAAGEEKIKNKKIPVQALFLWYIVLLYLCALSQLTQGYHDKSERELRGSNSPC